MVVTTSWLIDKSAYARLTLASDADEWARRIERGLVRVAFPTVLEIGYSARSGADWTMSVTRPPLSLMPREHMSPQTENRALDVQGILAQRGHHRAPSVPDLLVAALAELADLTVLHVDKDFELITEVTGQPLERLDIT
jgi:predicted nucleic acid-binding protein